MDSWTISLWVPAHDRNGGSGAVSGEFRKADAQISKLGVSCRPIRDSRGYYIWMVFLQILRVHARIAFDRLLLRLNRDN